MSRVLTGIQSSGETHLGNILGAIVPAITFSRQSQGTCLYFIADLHALTTLGAQKVLHTRCLEAAAAWLACGLDTKKHLLYRQSRVPEVCELAWYLGCLTPYPMLANAHAFKEKSEQLSEVPLGLFTYPVLMAADILLYKADIVPVGKDQVQHLEITRDIASSFNRRYGEVFPLPQAHFPKHHQLIPGTDGRKMSKSYRNTINIFLPEPALRKQIMSIQTDSTALEAPKNPQTCTLYTLYSLLASSEDTKRMAENYQRGGYGYGEAKHELFTLILEHFKEARTQYNYYLSHTSYIEEVLCKSEAQASMIAQHTLHEVRKALGVRLYKTHESTRKTSSS